MTGCWLHLSKLQDHIAKAHKPRKGMVGCHSLRHYNKVYLCRVKGNISGEHSNENDDGACLLTFLFFLSLTFPLNQTSNSAYSMATGLHPDMF